VSGRFPAEATDLALRHKAYLGGRTIASAVGWIPLLLLYVMIHTTFLRSYEPASKAAQVLVLIVVPFSWFALVVLTYRWLGPAVHKLVCPGCGDRLVDETYEVALETGCCPRCRSPVLSDRKVLPP
jgi:hypothetical protein